MATRRIVRTLALLGAFAVLLSACTPFHAAWLSRDATNGRNNNTPGSELARKYLIDFSIGIGAEALDGTTNRASFEDPITNGTNVLARIPGTDLADEIVLVGAHYDHVGNNCDTQGTSDTICNGATDNAAGAAVALEIMSSFARAETAPRRTVVFAFWDREEDGLVGAEEWIAANPTIVDDVVAYVNYDIQGANLLPSLRNQTLAVGGETGGPSLQAAVGASGSASPLDLSQLSLIFGQGRSDHAEFAQVEVPTIFFTDATGRCYHTVLDDFSNLDAGKLDKQRDIGISLVEELAAGSTTPVWTPAPLATYDDAVTIHGLVEAGLDDLDLFTPSQQTTLTDIEAELRATVDAGPGAFGGTQLNRLLVNSANLVSLLSSGECDGYLAD